MNIVKHSQIAATAYQAQSGYLRALISTAVVVSATLLGGTLGLLGYRAAFDGRALHGVTVSGLSYGGLDSMEVRTRIASQAAQIESLPLHVSTSQTTTTLKALGISLDTEKATTAVLDAGRTGTAVEQLRTTAALLVSPAPVRWEFQASANTSESLAAFVEGQIYPSTDATLTLVDGAVVVTPEQQGMVVDLPATLAGLETTYLRGIPTSFRIALAPSIPSIGKEELTALLPTVTAHLARTVSVTAVGVTGTASQADILSWITLPNEATTTLAFDEAAIAAWIDAATAKAERAPVDRQVLASGSVVSEGQAGRTVDTVSTARQLQAALASNTTASVVVPAVMTTTEPATKVVAAETTAGLYPGKYVEVDLSNQQLYQYEGEQLVARYLISSGKASTPTPVGTYTIQDKAPRAYSARFGLYLPYWMPFIGSTYGLHALPEWPNGYREGENHLGRAVSHGCVRLSTANAATLYQWIEVGTPIVIHR